MPLTQTQIDELKARVAALRRQQQQSCAVSALAAKKNAVRAPTSAALPRGAKSIEQILEELNALDDPADQTLYWRENYDEIKRAQGRARYAEVLATDERRHL